MTTTKRPLVDVTPHSMREYAAELVKLAEFHGKIADLMQAAGIEGVSAGNLKTGVNALVGLGNFCGAITKALCDEISVDGLSELNGAVDLFERVQKRRQNAPDSAMPNVDELRASRKVQRDSHRDGPGGKPKKPPKNGG